MLTTRWCTIIIDDDELNRDELYVGQYHVRRNIRTTDMQSAAAKAVEVSNLESAEYPDETLVGVVNWDETLDWDFSYPGSPVNPDTFTWFRVECVPIPSYRVRKYRKEVI